MESALYLIEANQPVYPLDLTRSMRDQRASMIQTGPQYKFVCQAILQVYKEGKVKPSPEFCQTTTSGSGNSNVTLPISVSGGPTISVSGGPTTTNNNNPPSVTNIVTSTTQAASTWKKEKQRKEYVKPTKISSQSLDMFQIWWKNESQRLINKKKKIRWRPPTWLLW
jgi:hypothetical protein